MGSLYKRGRIWWMKYYVDGRPIRESTRSTTDSEARRILRHREGLAAAGRPLNPGTAHLRIETLLANLLRDYQSNDRRSLKSAKGHLARLTRTFGVRRATTLSPLDLRVYIEQRQTEGAKNSTINRELSKLKRAYNLAISDGLLQTAPHIPKLKERNVRTGFFTNAQLTSLHAALPRELQPILQFAAYSGWRKGEVLTLRWIDCDLQAGIVRLEPGHSKGEEGRTLPLTPDILAMFRAQRTHTTALEHRTKRIIPWVFHRHGTQIREFRRAWKSACRKAGVPGAHFHDLRRTAVRNLVRASVPERVAMQITGHKTRSIFDRYDIVSEQDLRLAASKLAASRAHFRAQSGTHRGRKTS